MSQINTEKLKSEQNLTNDKCINTRIGGKKRRYSLTIDKTPPHDNSSDNDNNNCTLVAQSKKKRPSLKSTEKISNNSNCTLENATKRQCIEFFSNDDNVSSCHDDDTIFEQTLSVSDILETRDDDNVDDNALLTKLKNEKAEDKFKKSSSSSSSLLDKDKIINSDNDESTNLNLLLLEKKVLDGKKRNTKVKEFHHPLLKNRVIDKNNIDQYMKNQISTIIYNFLSKDVINQLYCKIIKLFNNYFENKLVNLCTKKHRKYFNYYCNLSESDLMKTEINKSFYNDLKQLYDDYNNEITRYINKYKQKRFSSLSFIASFIISKKVDKQIKENKGKIFEYFLTKCTKQTNCLFHQIFKQDVINHVYKKKHNKKMI
uniref:Wsv310-like protein n=1 Tax=Metapenaeus ensis majanivirus TaxID=2984279 RepID=A0A9C7C8L7_9VIRU|nr:MAG: wsv310-like protein [Metapenaeus ensis majanivirus]